MAGRRTKVFISSSMGELSEERAIVRQAIVDMDLVPFAFERDAIASPLSPKDQWEVDLGDADVCLVMLWRKLGEWTVNEMETARRAHTPILLFVKVGDPDTHDDVDQRAPMSNEVAEFLEKEGDVELGLSPKWFDTAEELTGFVRDALADLQKQALIDAKRARIDNRAAVHGGIRVAEETAAGHGAVVTEAKKVKAVARDVALRHRIDRFPKVFLGRGGDRDRLAKTITRQPFTPVVGLDEMGRKALVQVMAYDEWKNEFSDGAGLTPIPQEDGEDGADGDDRPSVAADEPIEDILQAVWESVYDVDESVVDVTQRTVDLKKLQALVALTDVELDAGRVQELVNALENSRIVATMPEGLDPPGRAVVVSPMVDAEELLAVFADEVIEVPAAMREQFVVRFAPTEGLPAEVARLVDDAFANVTDEASLAAWLSVDPS